MSNKKYYAFDVAVSKTDNTWKILTVLVPVNTEEAMREKALELCRDRVSKARMKGVAQLTIHSYNLDEPRNKDGSFWTEKENKEKWIIMSRGEQEDRKFPTRRAAKDYIKELNCGYRFEQERNIIKVLYRSSLAAVIFQEV